MLIGYIMKLVVIQILFVYVWSAFLTGRIVAYCSWYNLANILDISQIFLLILDWFKKNMYTCTIIIRILYYGYKLCMGIIRLRWSYIKYKHKTQHDWAPWIFLDSEWNDEAIVQVSQWCLFIYLFFYPVYKTSTTRRASI